MTFTPVGETEKLLNKIRKLAIIHWLDTSKILNSVVKYKV